MRSAAILSLMVLALPAAQQPTTKPKKILTPEQIKYQAQLSKISAQRDTLRAQAKAAYDNEMAREKAGDCPNAMTTYDMNVCYGKVSEQADKNLKAFDDAFRAMLGLPQPKFPGSTPDPNNHAPTPEQKVAEFDKIESQWHAYADTACTAAYNEYYGGTIAPSMQMTCHISLVRNHLRELDAIYDHEVTHPH